MNNKKSKIVVVSFVFFIVLVFFVFITIMCFVKKSDPGQLINMTQVQDMVFTGKYTTEKENEQGEKEKVVVDTGYVTDIYVVGGTGFIRIEKTELGNKPFPRFADYHFTYNNTTEDLGFIQVFNDMVDLSRAGLKTYNYYGNDINIEAFANLEKINYSKVNPKK